MRSASLSLCGPPFNQPSGSGGRGEPDQAHSGDHMLSGSSGTTIYVARISTPRIKIKFGAPPPPPTRGITLLARNSAVATQVGIISLLAGKIQGILPILPFGKQSKAKEYRSNNNILRENSRHPRTGKFRVSSGD